MNVKISGIQDSGKTLYGIAIVWLICWERFGYLPSRTYGNLHIRKEGFNYRTNDELVRMMDKVFRTERGKHRDMVFFIDEIDGVFSHRAFKEMKIEETKMISGLWQNIKLGIWVVSTMHEGKGVDKLIRDSTQISILTNYNRETDLIKGDIINGIYKLGGIENPLFMPLYNASWFYDKYDRWEAIL